MARFAIDPTIQVAQLLLSYYGFWLAWQVLYRCGPGHTGLATGSRRSPGTLPTRSVHR